MSGGFGSLAAAGRVSVRLLGQVEAERDLLPVALTGGKQRLLLAALAFRANQAVPVGRLVDDLWGERPPAQAEKTLRAHVSHLRAALGDEGGALLRAMRPGYVLELGGHQLDTTTFTRLSATGRSALEAGDPARAAAVLADALGLWRGEPAQGCDLSPDLRARVVLLEEERLATLEDRLTADLALGRHAVIIGELETLVASYPLRERLRELQMLALYRAGRQAEALRAYQAARRTLIDDLGIEPGTPLRDLEAAILKQDPALDLSVASATVERASLASTARPLDGSNFVGRAREVDVLRTALAAAIAGNGRLVTITGEAGAGKSRLLDELAARADTAGADVLRGACDDATGAPPFWPWVQVLRDLIADLTDDDWASIPSSAAGDLIMLVPELATRLGTIESRPQLEPDSARFRLFDAVAVFLAATAAHRPRVVMLDDLQWADVSSVQLLEFLTRRVRTTAVLLVATWRADETSPNSALGAALAALAGQGGVDSVALQGLDAGEVRLLLESASAVPVEDTEAALILERTGGNPLFVLELARAAAVGDSAVLPGSLSALLLRRVARLSSRARDALDVAAVAGRRFSVADLQRCVTAPRDAVLHGLDELLAAGLVRASAPHATSYEFHHDVTRQAVYAALPLARRADIHAALAGAIEAVDPTGSRVEEVAAHYIAAAASGQHIEDAVRLCFAVAERAERSFAYDRAVAHYERALEFLDMTRDAGGIDRTALLLRLGRASWNLGAAADSRRAFELALALGRERGDAATEAEAAMGIGLRGVTNGAVDGTLVAMLERANAALGPDDDVLRARVLARLALELYFSSRRDAARELAYESVVHARLGRDRAVLADALFALHFCLRRPGLLAERRAVGEELLAVADSAGVPDVVLRARHALLGDFVEAGDLDAYVEDLDSYTRLAEEVRDPRYRAHALAWRALLCQLTGQFERAEQLAEEALALGSPVQPDVFMQIYGAQIGTLRWEQDRTAEVRDVIAAFIDTYRGAPAWRAATALFATETGRADEARAIVEFLAKDSFAAIPHDSNWFSAMAVLAFTVRNLDDRATAKVLFDLLEPYADSYVAVGGVAVSASYGSVRLMLGMLAELTGDAAAAERLYDGAIVANERVGAVPWVARAEAALGLLLGRSEDDTNRARGEILRRRAAATASRLGMAQLARELAAFPGYRA